MSYYVKLVGYCFKCSGDERFFSDYITINNCNQRVLADIRIINEDVMDTFGIQRIKLNAEKVLRDTNFGDLVCSNSDWSIIDMYPVKGIVSQYAVLLSAVYSCLCYKNVLLCHASLVDYNGHGILFVGPSGIGKTTQAELWHKYRNATIINGDKAFLKMENDKLVGYGLPWKGSSEYCLNSDVNLNAVIVLRQDNENNIRRLNGEEKLSLFAPHIFLPHWDEKCMESALETLDKVLNTVPVYLLKCRPDEESVKLTEATVLG